MDTKDFLAEELLKAGLPDMAAKAGEGDYHDFMSVHGLPELQLLTDLTKAGTQAALELRVRQLAGDFDASPEERDNWAAIRKGRHAFPKRPPQRK
jgi:hypothetical protein